MDLPYPFSNSEFDAITAGEILEHLEDPMGFLRACYETLAPGGILVLSTPNPNSPIERLLTITLSRRFFYTDDHIMLFPQRWLIRMLERSGFSDVRLYSGGFPVPPLGLVPFPRAWCYQTIASAVRKA
jgi:SAM-dependent methyltransferase